MKTAVSASALTILVALACLCLGLAFADAYPDSSEVKYDDSIASYDRDRNRQSRAAAPELTVLFPHPRVGRRSPSPVTWGAINRASDALCGILPDIETLCWDQKKMTAPPRTGRLSNLKR